MKQCVFVERGDQLRWLAENGSDVVRDSMLVAVTPEAAFACQQAGQAYTKFEDTVSTSRRAEYAHALESFLTWQRWVDEWVRARISDLAGTAFGAAECATYNLQMLHAEIWSTGRSLTEFFEATGVESLVLWRPLIRGVPTYLQPDLNPLVHLAADAATERGLVVRDLTREHAALASVADVSAKRENLRARMRRSLADGPLRGIAAAYRTGGLNDAVRASLPVFGRSNRVLACGFGYDLQRAVLELRRAGVAVEQISSTLDPPDHGSMPAVQAMRRLTDELFSEPCLWTPIEECEVGRTALWRTVLERWWRDLVPQYWTAYRSAARRFASGRYQAVIVNSVGDERSEGPVTAAAKAAGVRTLLYQHGGSSDLDSPSLIAWMRGVDEMLVYGEGTKADLEETMPPFADRVGRLIPVGSSTLDEVAARGRTAAHAALRKQLQGDDFRPLVLYVPTHFAPYGRAVSELAGHPVVSYFELLQRALSLWKDQPSVRLVYKDFVVAIGRSLVIPRFIRNEIPGAIVTTARVTDVMWAVDAIVVDHVITAAVEVLLAEKPSVFFMPASTPQADRARALLRCRGSVATTAPDFLEAIRQLLARQEFHSIQNTDRGFLTRYGTHVGDGRSAVRVADLFQQNGPAGSSL